jgi:hypothetical protein
MTTHISTTPPPASDGPDREQTRAGARPYVHFQGMTWPHPDDPTGIEWRLRHGEPTRSDLLVAASYIAAYRQLVVTDNRRRRDQKIRAIRDARS